MFDFLIHVATVASIYALVSVALNVQAGYAGLLNLGHIAFVGIGAYAVGLSHSAGTPVWLAVLAGSGAAAALAFVMARLGRDLGNDYWGIATLAIAEILRIVALNEDWLTGGAQGISGIPSLLTSVQRPWDRLAFLVCAATLTLAAALLSRRLSAGRFGRALRLMREEPALATSLGYDLMSLKARAAMVSAVMASLGGSLLAVYMSFVGPDYMLSSETFLVWTMVMIGGLGNAGGAVVGALLVQAVYAAVPFTKDFFGIGSDIAGAVRLALIGCLLLACLLWRTQGLVPEQVRRVR